MSSGMSAQRLAMTARTACAEPNFDALAVAQAALSYSKKCRKNLSFIPVSVLRLSKRDGAVCRSTVLSCSCISASTFSFDLAVWHC